MACDPLAQATVGKRMAARTNMLLILSAVLVLIVAHRGIGAMAQRLPGSLVGTGKSEVEAWLTTGDELAKLQQQPGLNFSPGTGSNSTQILVGENTHYQQIEGFGASVTDSAAWVISSQLTLAQRDALMTRLFSPSGGIGISFVRVPMGASDFARYPYTYDDMSAGQSDPDLAHFSIDHDRSYILPILRQASSINPQLKFLASPWSPPAWMKQSNTLNGSSLNPANYQPFARYFIRFIQAYEAEGIPIYAVTLQNEPNYADKTYPTMRMGPTEQANIVKNYVGPAFVSAGINTKILVWDHNWSEASYPLTVLGDASARAFVAGSAWHCYGGDPSAQDTVHNAYPDKEVYFTECTGGDWMSGFSDSLVWMLQNVFIGATRNWAKTVVLWNLALDENNGPRIGGWCEGCRGVVKVRPGGVTDYQVEYYVIGHFSKFVMPGAYRIASSTYSGAIETVAFHNADDTLALIALNPGQDPKSFDVQWAGRYFSYTLPAQSVVTFKWAGNHAIAGTVTSSNGFPLAGITIGAGGSLSATTSITGYYRFVGLAAGTYLLVPSQADYVFLPPSATLTVPQASLQQNFVMLPRPVTSHLLPDAPASLRYTDTQGLSTVIEFPAGAVTLDTTLVLTPTMASSGAGYVFTGHAFDLAAWRAGLPLASLAFSTPVTVTIGYSAADVRVVADKSLLALMEWTGGEWREVTRVCGSEPIQRSGSVILAYSVPICETGQFALFGPTHQAYLPLMWHD
jgi:glucosylceramidase